MVGARPRGTSTYTTEPLPKRMPSTVGSVRPHVYSPPHQLRLVTAPTVATPHVGPTPLAPFVRPVVAPHWLAAGPAAHARRPAHTHSTAPVSPLSSECKASPARDRGPVTGVGRRGRAPRQGFARRAPATHVGLSPPHARRVVDRASSWRGVEVTFSCPSISCQISGDGGKQLRLYNPPFNVNVVGEGIRLLQNDLATVRLGPGRGRFSGLGADRPRHCYLARARSRSQHAFFGTGSGGGV